jgi:hypothetical protein
MTCNYLLSSDKMHLEVKKKLIFFICERILMQSLTKDQKNYYYNNLTMFLNVLSRDKSRARRIAIHIVVARATVSFELHELRQNAKHDENIEATAYLLVAKLRTTLITKIITIITGIRYGEYIILQYRAEPIVRDCLLRYVFRAIVRARPR